ITACGHERDLRMMEKLARIWKPTKNSLTHGRFYSEISSLEAPANNYCVTDFVKDKKLDFVGMSRASLFLIISKYEMSKLLLLASLANNHEICLGLQGMH
ncbi:hypothetical protein ACJX0J_039125, partial [Zea mays]